MVALVEDLPDSRMLDDENLASDSSQEQGSKKLDLLCGWGTVTVAPYSLARRIDASDFSRQEPEFRSAGIGRADDRSTGRSHCGGRARAEVNQGGRAGVCRGGASQTLGLTGMPVKGAFGVSAGFWKRQSCAVTNVTLQRRYTVTNVTLQAVTPSICPPLYNGWEFSPYSCSVCVHAASFLDLLVSFYAGFSLPPVVCAQPSS